MPPKSKLKKSIKDVCNDEIKRDDCGKKYYDDTDVTYNYVYKDIYNIWSGSVQYFLSNEGTPEERWVDDCSSWNALRSNLYKRNCIRSKIKIQKENQRSVIRCNDDSKETIVGTNGNNMMIMTLKSSKTVFLEEATIGEDYNVSLLTAWNACVRI